LIVLDASVTLAWIHEDERTPQVVSIARQSVKSGVIVPSLWASEIANALLMASRRKRMTEAGLNEALATLRRLRLSFDHTPHDLVWRQVLPLAMKHSLTVYDATYLELAIRKQLPLATLDEDLAAAARAENLEILP
jgi:predicted nucleic acid-binding protein